jgi:hypothetical protein
VALSLPFHGSGVFVPERVWSCSVHDRCVFEYEDDPWESPGGICLECETGQWLDKKDENGKVITRELSTMEHYFGEIIQERDHKAFQNMLDWSANPDAKVKFVWNEDDL